MTNQQSDQQTQVPAATSQVDRDRREFVKQGALTVSGAARAVVAHLLTGAVSDAARQPVRPRDGSWTCVTNGREATTRLFAFLAIAKRYVGRWFQHFAGGAPHRYCPGAGGGGRGPWHVSAVTAGRGCQRRCSGRRPRYRVRTTRRSCGRRLRRPGPRRGSARRAAGRWTGLLAGLASRAVRRVTNRCGLVVSGQRRWRWAR